MSNMGEFAIRTILQSLEKMVVFNGSFNDILGYIEYIMKLQNGMVRVYILQELITFSVKARE